jgi:dolichol-phosphate mannosyltransferase
VEVCSNQDVRSTSWSLIRFWRGTGIAMVCNFALNNLLTYRDRRLRGWLWFRGLASFVLACSVGALANVGIATYLFAQHSRWFLAALAGVLVGAVWNYSVTQFYTWGTAGRVAETDKTESARSI